MTTPLTNYANGVFSYESTEIKRWKFVTNDIVLSQQLVVFFLVASLVSYPLWPYGLQTTRLLCSWDSPGKNTGAGCHALLQGIFLAQGSNLHLLCLLHWQESSLSLTPPAQHNLKAKFIVWKMYIGLHNADEVKAEDEMFPGKHLVSQL